MTQNEFQGLFQAVWDGDEAAAHGMGDFLVEYALDLPQGTAMFFAVSEGVVGGIQTLTILECHFENDGQGNRKIRADLRDSWGVWRTTTYRTDDPGNDAFATLIATQLPKDIAWTKTHLIDSLRRDRGDDRV